MEELIERLRKAAKESFMYSDLLNEAAEILECECRKNKFNVFVWEALGWENMWQLISAYDEIEGKKNGRVY